MIVINGRFLTQPITGVQRFAIEISRKLKKILGDKLLIISPDQIIHREIGEELGVVTTGKLSGHLWEQIELVRFLKKNRSPLLVNLCNTAPIRYTNKIVTLHDIAYEKFPESFTVKFRLLYKFLVPKILSTSKHVITVSEFSKKEIMEFYNLSPQKISVVYNAVNNHFKPQKSETADKYIFALSSNNYQKNFHSLLKAFRMLNRNDVKLIVGGGKNPRVNQVSVQEYSQVEDNIVFTGRLTDEELIQYYSNAECFVFPSLYEGFGIPPLEAQACGCPVIASNAASLPEILSDSAYFVNPIDIAEISDAINLLINSNELKATLIQKGFENVARYSWEKSANKLMTIIERVCE
ncbi:MAG: glycosyltransferase family 1 protein [Calditrichia bacterium]